MYENSGYPPGPSITILRMTFQANFEIKVDINLDGKELKRLVQKLSISIWNKLSQEGQMLEKDEFSIIGASNPTVISNIGMKDDSIIGQGTITTANRSR